MSLQPMGDSLAWLAAWAGVYLRVIQVVTGVAALLIAMVVLLLDRELLPKARWPKLFGWSYTVFGLQYLVPAIAMWLVTWLLDASGVRPAWLPWMHAFCSAVNNVLFLACARALLEKRRPFTPAAWIAAALSVAANLAGSGTWFRLPDAAFSAFCLGFLGYALYRNFSPSRRPLLAGLNLVGGFLYGGVNLFYALNPLLASIEGSFQASLFNNLANLAKVRSILQPPSVETALDALAFGAAFLLKLALFLGALLLIMRSLSELSPSGSRLTLESIQDHRRAFLSDEVVARAIGKSAGADVAEVGFRLPGLRANKVMWWSWLKDPGRKEIKNPAVLDMQDPETSIVGGVFKSGQEEFFGDWRRDPDVARRYQEFVPGMSSFATLPVLYQGGIIGCLNVEWSDVGPIDATTRFRLRQAAANLAPVLDARRQLYALHTLSHRVHEGELRSPSKALEALRELLNNINDLHSPLATAMVLNLGFRRYSLAASDFCEIESLQDNLNYGTFTEKVRAALRGASLKFEEVRVGVWVGKLRLGTLVAFVTPGRDEPGRPSLLGDYLHRRAVASIVSNSLLAIARRSLGGILALTQAELATIQPLAHGRWFDAIQTLAADAGLPWVAATVVTGSERIRLGVDRLPRDVVARVLELEASGDAEGGPTVHTTPEGAVFLHLPLPASKSALWLGLKRIGFGRELSGSLPWRDFLTQLAESADAALLRFERQRLLLETSRMELLAAKVETSRLLLHEVRNRAMEFSAGALGVRTALEREQPNIALSRMKDLEQETIKFSQLANAAHGPSDQGHRPITALKRAVALVQALVDSRLLPLDIKLTAQIDSEIQVAVPLELLVLCLRELIENAARAIGKSGAISIDCENAEQYIDCHVMDTGTGVTEPIRDQLFEVGITTRQGGGGMGLALARNALITVGGFLRLSSSEPGHTVFTLQLPKTSKEDSP